MSHAVITVEGLSKRYTLRHQGGSGLLRDQLANLLRNPFRKTKNTGAAPEDFWALRDLNFTVNPGDVVGIVGRNGAGKSTLLKILSRITEPTTGRITIEGRVASLLEVGTGFHGELSGRENIYLNGAILGMRRAEIRKKFDEIVAFSEVEKFLDTPVKHYSSGMYVRLAFAVAAHLEPEILIVDEVLAVGDAAFQKKCLGKMHEVSTSLGRTVLFVSHNTSALIDICKTGLWLDKGLLCKTGTINETIASYLQTNATLRSNFTASDSRPSIVSVEIDTVKLQQGDLVFRVGFKSPCPLRPPVIGINIYTRYGQAVFGANTRMASPCCVPESATEGTITGSVIAPPLRSGQYRASFWLGDATQDFEHKPEALSFDFVGRDFHPQAPRPEITGPLHQTWQWGWQP